MQTKRKEQTDDVPTPTVSGDNSRHAPISIPKYFILATLSTILLSTSNHPSNFHGQDKTQFHEPVPTIVIHKDKDHEQPLPPLGWRHISQHIHRYGFDDPSIPQSKSFIHRVKEPDAPEYPESNISTHPEQAPNDPEYPEPNIIDKNSTLADKTRREKFPVQQNNIFTPFSKNIQQFCPFDPISSITDEQHHLPRFNTLQQTATHRRLALTRPADNKSHLMPASTILAAPMAILLIATHLHRRTQHNSAISYLKSSASADSETRPLP